MVVGARFKHGFPAGLTSYFAIFFMILYSMLLKGLRKFARALFCYLGSCPSYIPAHAYSSCSLFSRHKPAWPNATMWRSRAGSTLNQLMPTLPQTGKIQNQHISAKQKVSPHQEA